MGKIEEQLPEIAEEKKEAKRELFDLEKTEEEIRMIEIVKSYLEIEFSELGIKKSPVVSSEDIHIYNQERWEKLGNIIPHGGMDAFTICGFNWSTLIFGKSIYINKEPLSKIVLLKAILHESIHLNAFYEVRHEGNGRLPVREAFNYDGSSRKNGKYETRRIELVPFAEAVTEKLSREIINEHREDIAKEFDLTPEEVDNLHNHSAYKQVIGILDYVIDSVEQSGDMKPGEYWTKIKKSHFDGSLTFFRDIVRVFGKDALKVLQKMKLADKEEEFEHNRNILKQLEEMKRGHAK